MQILNLSFAGIYSNTNNLNDQTINGGLLKADNIVIDEPNVAKSRRGQKKYNTNTNPIRSLATYQSTLIAFTNDEMLIDDGSGDYTSVSSSISSPSTSKKIHYSEANKNFYFCDAKGVYKLDTIDTSVASPFLAGCPQALAITSFTSVASGTAIPDKKQVAYRILFGYRDRNNNLILGAPSDRKIFRNESGGVVDVQGTFPLPQGIDTTFFYQVYRSTATDYDTSDPNNIIDVPPDDELQLIIEKPIEATDVTNGYATFEDVSSESLMGAFLYTNETQEGITQSNYQPPLCKDIALYKNCLFYANTKTIATYSTSLLGTDNNVDGTKVLHVGDWIKIGNVTFTGVTTVSDPNVEFLIVDNQSPAEDIEATVINFINCVNSYQPALPTDPECPCYAFYSSSDSDISGKFTLQAKDKNANNISITTNKPEAFFPVMTGAKAVCEENVNRVYFSKPQQPEAVPVLNYIDVGSANYEIKRIVALRDSLFVLKSDGIYRIAGESASSFTCKLFDGTIKIIASETAVAFNNMVYAVADQGIITVSETGVSIISMPIENDLFELSEFSNFATLSFAVAYGSDRKYILFVPSTPNDTTCTQAFVYNSYTNSFVRWVMPRSCGVVRPNEAKQGELFLGTSGGVTYIERKTFTLEDYCDDEYQVTVIASQPYKITVSSLPDEVGVGFTIRQDRLSSIIEKIVERIVIPDDPNDSPYTVFDLTLSNNSLYETQNAEITNGYDSFPITIITSEAYSIVVNSIPDEAQVGDSVVQGNTTSVITAIDTLHHTLTLATDEIYNVANSTIYTPIKKTIEWFPLTCQNPAFFKHFREITFMFLEAKFKNLSFTVYSDSSPDAEETKIEATSLGAWGYGGWGNLPWGGDVGGRQAIRSYIPLEKSRCRWLDLTLTSNQAFTQFAVSGISLMYSLASERDTR